MDISREQLSNMLVKVFAFHRLKSEYLAMLLADAELLFFPTQKMVFMEGSQAEFLYIVYQGQIEILKERAGALIYKNKINPTFSFGEDIFAEPYQRRTSARAAQDTILIKISRGVVQEIAAVDGGFQRAMLRQFTSYTHLLETGLEKIADETLCYLSRAHPINVILKIAAFFTAFLSVGFLAIMLQRQGLFSTKMLQWGVALLAAAGIGWMLWVYLEWSNDLFFFTDKRVNTTRRTHLVLEEQLETPLSAIESIQVRANLLGRALGYGGLLINTYTGSTHIANVPLAEDAQDLLQFLVARRRASADSEALNGLREEMLQRIERPVSDPTAFIPGGEDDIAADSGNTGLSSEAEISSQPILLRKHFTVLVAKIFIPLLLLLSHVLFYLFIWVNAFDIQRNAVFNWIMAVNCIFLALWTAYRFADWHNDRFIITRDMLVDIDKRPFGMEERRAAPLDRIQSVRYKKKGFFGLLFNFGTVYIRIGDEEFTFDDLYRPVQVTEMIFSAKERLLEQEKAKQVIAERKRALDWIETYHHLQKQEKSKNGENGPEAH